MNELQQRELNKYIDKGFSDDQLYEIRLGIEQGYDVTAYARVSISPEDMSHIRKSISYRLKIESETKEKLKEAEKENEQIRTEMIRQKHAKEDPKKCFTPISQESENRPKHSRQVKKTGSTQPADQNEQLLSISYFLGGASIVAAVAAIVMILV